jgi:hypothetical protein
MKIIFVYPPRNHKLWVLIFLLSIFGGCEVAKTRADETQPTPKQWLDTRDTLEDRGDQQQRTWRMIYGSTPKQAQETQEQRGETIPDTLQASSNPEIQKRPERAVKHSAAESRAPRGISFPLRQQDAGRGYCPTDPSTPNEKTLHQKIGQVSGGD